MIDDMIKLATNWKIDYLKIAKIWLVKFLMFIFKVVVYFA